MSTAEKLAVPALHHSTLPHNLRTLACTVHSYGENVNPSNSSHFSSPEYYPILSLLTYWVYHQDNAWTTLLQEHCLINTSSFKRILTSIFTFSGALIRQPVLPPPLCLPHYPAMSDEERSSKDSLPRKRSKVSRACDACRRKKIRCDAEFLQTLQKVTKICTNCVKNAETCTFSRIPLKRGPSKGYIRDLVDKMDDQTAGYPSTHHTSVLKLQGRPRLKSVDTSKPESNAQGIPTGSPPNAHSDQRSGSVSSVSSSLLVPTKPLLHRLTFSNGKSSSSPIILPPLLGPQPSKQPVKLSVPVLKVPSGTSVPLSPHGGPGMETKDPKIREPLWTVPYEMPNSNSHGLDGSASNLRNGLASNLRRSSVDSVSSILTSGSRSRFSSLKSTGNSDMAMSDSDDDYYSSRSRAYSASLSPRNSVSSLLSLNGKMNRLLDLNNTHPPQPSHFQHSPQPLHFNNNGHQRPPENNPVALPFHSLEHNINMYYTKYHANFSVLPFSQPLIVKIVHTLINDPSAHTSMVVELFRTALNNLLYYQHVPLSNLIALLRSVMSIYPFNHNGIMVNDDLLIVFFSTLVLINYTILINGDVYSLGIAMTASVFNDFKLLENFATLVRDPASTRLSPDDVQLYLPRLYMCLYMIDNTYSLSFGSLLILPSNYDLFIRNIAMLMPSEASQLPFYYNVQASMVINDLVMLRADSVLSSSPKPRYRESWSVKTSPNNPTNSMVPNFASLFVSLIKDKYELYDNLQEVMKFFEAHPPAGSPHHADDSLHDALYDHQLKISRLLKKLTQSLLNFDNYISTIYSNNKSITSAGDLIGPFFNLSYGQSFKLIKACKLLVDPLMRYATDSELYTRSVKIMSDLSIAYNLLVSNVNNNLNAITNARTTLSSPNKYPNLSPSSPANEPVNVSGLGLTSITLILSKIDHHKLQFNSVSGPPAGDSLTSRVGNFDAWRREVSETITTFIQREDLDGWF